MCCTRDGRVDEHPVLQHRVRLTVRVGFVAPFYDSVTASVIMNIHIYNNTASVIMNQYFGYSYG